MIDVEKMRQFSEERNIESYNIITLMGNEVSENLALRCYNSIYKNIPGARTNYVEAYDGTDNENIVPPVYKTNYIPLIKVPNNIYSASQIACFLSHFALWMECILINKPIAILEHDAVCIKEFRHHKYYNCIQFLGCKEQVEGSLRVESIPPHASIYGGYWRSLCRAHSYAIDPPVARMLVSKAIHEGMTKTLDMWIRADIFPIIQDGVYFYDERGESTIHAPEDTLKDY